MSAPCPRPGAPRPRSRRPGHPAAGPGSGPQSCPAGLSPTGLLDSPAEESQESIAAARILPPQFMLTGPRPGHADPVRTLKSNSVLIIVLPRSAPHFFTAPRAPPRAPGAPAPLPTLGRTARRRPMQPRSPREEYRPPLVSLGPKDGLPPSALL
jgi:hypothetical protein